MAIKKIDPMAQLMPGTGDMSAEQFRALGYQYVDWVSHYLETVGEKPVLSQVKPGWVKSQLPSSPPQDPESLSQAIDDLDRIITPANTHWNHPGFFAYFSITGSTPGILGELVSAAYNVNGMLWKTSPACTELEEVVLDWLKQMLGLPRDWFGLVNDTASVASLCAIAAARESLDLKIREEGMAGRTDLPALCLYTSEHSHSSIEKGAIVLGIGQKNVRKIAVDAEFKMRADALESAILEDLAAGRRPFCVCATVGTTSTTSVDPVPAIADICERYHLWLHVDAAYAGSAAVLPEFRYILDGCDRADSFITNPHKWMFTPVDFSAFYTRHPEILRRAFTLVPEYLRTDQGEEVRDLMNYGVSMGRRFRALKFWFVVRAFGVAGIQARLREHIRLAKRLAGWIDAHPDFERLAPTPFSTVCFRAHPKGVDDESKLEALNEQLLERVNATGRAFLSHTKLGGRFTIRWAIGNLRTDEARVEETWKILEDSLQEIHQGRKV
ncbi:MAG: pyridoxal-dependent decarboxylase [Acidobacteriia bacterium]|nr:pyridoxal-dependent decarboxylase [Terriglobia bacterium]